MAGDIAQAGTAGRVVELTLDRFERIDTLINNAGVFIRKSFTDHTPVCRWRPRERRGVPPVAERTRAQAELIMLG